MTKSRAYHLGLDRGDIVTAALELSRARGLYGWSVRDLSRALDVAPSVIYHHVGGRDLLCRHVVEMVVNGIAFPTEPGPWREWFSTALMCAREGFIAVPGTAKWLLLHGPVFHSLAPVVDAGMASLHDAGFGEFSSVAYSMLFSTAAQAVAMGDERQQHADDGPRDHGTLMAEFSGVLGDNPGLRVLALEYTATFVTDLEKARRDFYAELVEIVLDGLEVRLSKQARGERVGGREVGQEEKMAEEGKDLSEPEHSESISVATLVE